LAWVFHYKKKKSMIEGVIMMRLKHAVSAVILLVTILALLVGCAKNSLPVANLTASSTSGIAPIEISFDGSGSVDSDGSIVSYEWDFGDGSSATDERTTHTYDIPGVYTVGLTVTDNKETTASTAQTITVTQNTVPVARFTATPTQGEIPLEVIFNASASVDTDGSISSYKWSFGDGEGQVGVKVTHTYHDTGEYMVRLTVMDDKNGAGSATETIQTTHTLPVAILTAVPVSGIAPLRVEFDGSASWDPDGYISSFYWDLGDGASATGVNAVYTYRNPGDYTVWVTVVDDQDNMGTATECVRVSRPEVHEVGETVSNGYVGMSLRGVREGRSKEGWCEPDPGHIYVIAHLNVEALRNNQDVSRSKFRLIQSDGNIQDEYSMATCSLLRGFEDGALDKGQWIDGEIAFEVWPTSSYILEYKSDKGKILRFRFQL